jgi:hypothetical protein
MCGYYELGTTILHISHRWKPRHRESKQLLKSHSLYMQSWDLNPGYLALVQGLHYSTVPILHVCQPYFVEGHFSVQQSIYLSPTRR